MAAQRGLPASYIKKHNGDMKAAWADYRASAAPAGRKRRTSGETVLSTPEGGGITSRAGGGLRAHIGAHTVVQYDEEALGMILRGFVAAMRAPAGPDLTSMFPPPESEVDDASWRRGAQERELGKQLWERFGKAILYFRVTQPEWSTAYGQAVARAGGPGSMGGGGLTRPFDGAPVSSPFGAHRNLPGVSPDAHRGADYPAEEGTPVRAAGDARVDATWSDQAGGLNVRLALRRPDGTYPAMGRMTPADDSGVYVTYSHLLASSVVPGTEVVRGQEVGRVGRTGNATAPSVHVQVAAMLEEHNAGALTAVFLDPEAVFDPRLGSPTPPAEFQAVQAMVQPPGASAPTPTTVHIHGNGTVQVGSGAAVSIGQGSTWTMKLKELLKW